MRITVTLTESELESMEIGETELSRLILERVDSTIKNKAKIFHQVELEVLLKVDSVAKVAVQKKRVK